MSTDSPASSSSPRKRQLGFAPPIREVKVERMDQDGMNDIWAGMSSGRSGEMGAPTEHMDYDDLLGPDDGLMMMPSLTTSNQSESVSDMPNVPSSTSAKTTPESSNPFILSPAPSQFELEPVNKEPPISKLPLPTAPSAHSTESIAQMLEYMRACNSQDAPPSSVYSQSYQSDTSHQQQQQEEQQHRSGRKKERSTSRNTRHRKQLSPTQKLSRSYSHGSDANTRPGIAAAVHQQKFRQRSRTNAAILERDYDSALHIDTEGAVQATGPSGAAKSSSSRQQQQQPVSAGTTESTSLLSAPSWSGQSEASTSHTNQKSSTENLSLTEFLERPEGAMWFQHFQKQYPPRSAPEYPAPAAAYAQQQAPVHTPFGPLTPSISAHLPPPMDVANMLGMQQAPNQALVQAFQTAFVLGMQQLGMAGQFQQAVASPPHPIAQPVTQTFPFAWMTQQQQQQVAQASMQPKMADPQPSLANIQQPLHSFSNTNQEGESRDASSVLQSLLHDINQHRPDKQEFSLDEFLSFVASTVESTGDDHHQQQQQDEVTAKAPEPQHDEPKSKDIRKSRKMNVAPEAVAEKKKSSRRRTISISGQLSGTYLDDVAEDGVEIKRSDGKDGYHHKAVYQEGQESELVDEDKEDDQLEDEGDEEEEDKEEGSDEQQNHSKRHSRRHKSPSSSQQQDNNTKTTKEKEAHKLAERRRRRRESHNAVERRRRDHINERIAELASLLPESMLLDAIAASTSGGTMPHIDLSLFTRRPDGSSIANDITSSHRDLERKANALEPVCSSSETLALAQSKPNKGIILSKIVEYIKHLHEFCSVLRNKNSELQAEMDRNKALISMESALSSFPSAGLEDSTMATATPPTHLAS